MKSLVLVHLLLLPTLAHSNPNQTFIASLTQSEIQARHEVCLRHAYNDVFLDNELYHDRTPEQRYDDCADGSLGDPYLTFTTHADQAAKIVERLQRCGGTTATRDGREVSISDWVSLNCLELGSE